MKNSLFKICAVFAFCAVLVPPGFQIKASTEGTSRYQSLLATSGGRDSLMSLALWEDGRITGDGKLFRYLGSENALIRMRAVEVIGRIQDPQDVPQLLPLLEGHSRYAGT